MQIKTFPIGFFAISCLASTITAAPFPLGHVPNDTFPGRVIPREVKPTALSTLPPITFEVSPNGTLLVVSVPPPAVNATNGTLHSRDTLARKPKKPAEPTFFDGRPAKYMGQYLPYTVVANATERCDELSQLWDVGAHFDRLDDGKYYGRQKWYLLQNFNVGILPDKADDNHEDADFVARLFGTTTQSIKWFSNAMTTAKSMRPDEQWPEYAFYEPLEHFNWIRKAHNTLGKMNAAEQQSVNHRIDNIDKLVPGDLLELYEAFEVYPGMLEEHKQQVAEFLQITKLEFPIPGIGNIVKSTRKPIQIYEWSDKQHPRHSAPRPVDALARYAIPATDEKHDDWTSLTAIKLAHETPETQRLWANRVRMITASYPPTPRDAKDLYDMLNVNWQGKDPDTKKAEVAEKLCVRELVFPETPKKKKWPNNKEWNWDRVEQQPAMVNVCTEEQREERLKELFYIVRWDADRTLPDLGSVEKRDVEEVEGDGMFDGIFGKIGEKIDHKLEKLKPVKEMVKDELRKWEDEVDGDIEEIRGDVERLKEKTKPIREDVKDIGENIWDLGMEVFEGVGGN